MIRKICRDPDFLSKAAEPATAEDAAVIRDLLDTLAAHHDGCVGMAANMIGVCKRIIVFTDKASDCFMLNPTILRREGPYEAEEGCLSLEGTRKVQRWNKIKVQWQNEKMQTRIKVFSGWTAEIIQHEMDHCDGILI